MPKQETLLYAFNRGIVSPLALARVDLKRLALSAQTQNNWMPRVMGSMMLRPGLQYIGATASNAASRDIPFIRSSTAKAALEFTANLMRVWVDDALVTRPSVSSAVTNGNFGTDITGWTDNDESGGTSAWVTGGYMGLTGNGTANAVRDQTVTVAVADQNVVHALRVIVYRGPVVIRVGTGTTDDSYVNETTLQTGDHSLSFTPTGNFNIQFKSSLKRQVLVNSCNVEAAGVMTIPTPYGASDLQKIRASVDSQSVDVMFVGCDGYTQRRIERRNSTSWSVCQYLANDGPYLSENTGPITIAASATSGNITLTASAPLFKSTQAPSTYNAGALYRLTSSGQNVSASITAQNTFTNVVTVTGVGTARVFTLILTGLSGTSTTATLQRSLESSSGPWTDYANYTTDQSLPLDDGLDNQEVFYRVGVKTGNYSSGTIEASISYAQGSTVGVVRITGFSTNLSASAEVITDLGSTTATDIWAEGQWSDYRGWPSAGALYESRMAWAGSDKFQLSITDAFNAFDPEYEGDAGPSNRSIGSGPLAVINWILPLQRLILGADMSEQSVRSNAFDEPLTPTNLNIKPASTQGSANVQAVKIDQKGMYVQRGGTRLFEIDLAQNGVDYASQDMTLLCPQIGLPMIVRLGVQRQPDTRIHCVLSDGTAAVLVYDKRENVISWVTIDTDGLIEDVMVMPSESGEDEDRVYYTIARTINGSTVRYREKWALESECVGGTLNKQADAFVVFTNSPASTTVTGLSHLIGETVVAWYDGICPADTNGDIATYVVNASGEITLPEVATTGIVGLAYDARFLSAKLGTQLTHHKMINKVGLVLADTHAKGLRIGPSLTGDMDYLPLVHEGAIVDPDRVYTEYDQESQEFPGTWSTDSRLAMIASAPRPCTVMAAAIEGTVN